MRLIRVWDCVSNPIVSVVLCKACIITLLPHDGMSNLILWQAFSMFPIFCSLTCDSTSATLDWFRWGRRLACGKKEGCKGRTKALFVSSPVTLKVHFDWDQRSDDKLEETTQTKFMWRRPRCCRNQSLSAAAVGEFRIVFCCVPGLHRPQRSPGKRICTLFPGQVWHDSSLETKRVQGTYARALQTIDSGRMPVGAQRERRKSPAPGSHSSCREVRNTLHSLLPPADSP